jgi:hypothetical protein
MAVWYSLRSFGIFSPFWYVLVFGRKNLATLARPQSDKGMTAQLDHSDQSSTVGIDLVNQFGL